MATAQCRGGWAGLSGPFRRSTRAMPNSSGPRSRKQTSGAARALPLAVTRLPAAAQPPLEMVERKGLGHPDTICDAVAEEFSIALSRFYRRRFGMVMHHNVDKVLLRGGSARARFGGGRIVEPIELYLCGRATERYKGVDVPVRTLAIEAARGWIARHVPGLDPARDVRVHCLVRPGSADLVALFERAHATGTWLANDSSIGVGFAPLSPIERLVLDVDRELRSAAARRAVPGIGPDVKIMAAGRGREASLTVACAFVGRHVRDIDDYVAQKRRLAARLAAAPLSESGVLCRDIEVNAADDPATGSIYLTVSGTSAEAGDDGSTGRGNRINGLIAPGRPMTLEAAAGKNPVSHVGKLYNIAARAIAEACVSEIREVERCECWLASRIGRPVVDPHSIMLRVGIGRRGSAAGLDGKLREIARRELDGLRETWRGLLARRIALY